MAEMTAAKANELLILYSESPFMLTRTQSDEIAALIRQQAQTIDHQNLQIAKLQEDLIKAISEKE